MKRIVIAVAASCLALSPWTSRAEELQAWPSAAAEKLDAMIKENANNGEYAVFDMDNTSYQYDLTESLLAYLENKHVLTREKLDPSLKLIPFKDTDGNKESLFSYYYRLCEIDDLVCYPWIAQSFAGLSLTELKVEIDAMLADRKPVPVKYFNGDKVIDGTVNPPDFFEGMQELYAKLQANGVAVYVMTAANEEIVRMVASDPKYGYNVKPENVIGVNVLLRDPDSGALTTSRLQIKAGTYDMEANRKLVVTPYLMNPMTWYEGKLGSIAGWIDQWKKPILVAGDTPISDGYMLLNATDLAKGGLRLWINRKDKYMTQMDTWIADSAKKQADLGLEITADKNWVKVTPKEIQGAK